MVAPSTPRRDDCEEREQVALRRLAESGRSTSEVEFEPQGGGTSSSHSSASIDLLNDRLDASNPSPPPSFLSMSSKPVGSIKTKDSSSALRHEPVARNSGTSTSVPPSRSSSGPLHSPNSSLRAKKAVRLVSRPELFHTHSAASQKTLEENSRQSVRSSEKRTGHRSGQRQQHKLHEDPSQRNGRAKPHPSQSLSTLRTHSMRNGEESVSWNESYTSVNYDGAFENEPRNVACWGGRQHGVVDEEEYNPSLAATGSAYDVSGPFVAEPPSDRNNQDNPGSSSPQNRSGSSSQSPHEPSSSAGAYEDRGKTALNYPSWLWRCCLCFFFCDSARKESSVSTTTSSPQSAASLLWVRVSIFRDLCGRIVNDPKIELFVIALILANAALMGVGTFDFVTDNPAVSQGFDITDKVFLVLFTIESGLQFIYHGIHLFSDGWLLFDFLVIVLSWSFESMQIIRAFRIFRCVRLIARLDVLRKLVLSIFAVAPSMTAIVALLVLILYIFAVICTELFGDLYRLGYTDIDYFSTIFLSLFTLFSMMTLEWADVVRQVMQYSYWSSLLFSAFLIITSFILYSLVIAVVCDAVKVTEHQDEMKRHVEEKEETRQRVCALEHRIADITQHQGVIVEQLQLAVKELANLRKDESNGGRGYTDDDGSDHDANKPENDSAWDLVGDSGIADGYGPIDDDRYHATETTFTDWSFACPTSPSASSRKLPSSNGNNSSLALSAVFSERLGPTNTQDDDSGAEIGGTTSHAVVVPHRSGSGNDDEGMGGSASCDETMTHHDDDDDDDEGDCGFADEVASLDLAAMHRRYAAS